MASNFHILQPSLPTLQPPSTYLPLPQSHTHTFSKLSRQTNERKIESKTK
ncbi:hypothetical protein HYC85_015212 [Camellia sinensis]|uniref:Uncharacterized protein n=1 Tax=Camellia sinensis TaxID=4442 RepID=A0A7J7GZQ8_CAMSI|nr:hypothetical protein HYC85_015212 [Camellia sinensis]